MTIGRLTRDDSIRLLSQETFGRLGVVINADHALDRAIEPEEFAYAPYVVPYHFFFDGQDIWSHCLPGLALTSMRQNKNMCLQVDDIRNSYHWRSVIAFGKFEEVYDEKLREQALAELFRRVPHLTPVESKMQKGINEVVVFVMRPTKITGMGEEW